MDTFFKNLDLFRDWLWTYPAFFLLAILGLYFTIKSRLFQVRKLPTIIKMFGQFFRQRSEGPGVHPIKVFFASVGGAIGVGNIVGVSIALKIGGPGALFWLWVTGLLGMILKYSEVYLGVRYRVKNAHGSYDGGPMYFLQRAWSGKWIPKLVCLLLCVYGVEVFMFSQVTQTFVVNWHLSRPLVVAALLALTFYAGIGGVKRVGDVCSAVIPLFVVLYVGMSLWIFATHIGELPAVFAQIFKAAFTGQAAVGGFAGASVMISMAQGALTGSYSGDIGIGYASVIHSETRLHHPERQAALAIFGIILDTFIVCTSTFLLSMVTGVWTESIPADQFVQRALETTFPYINVFMPIFIFLLGYSTLLAYFVVGLKCAQFLSKKYGRLIFLTYAAFVLIIFAFSDPLQAYVLMNIAGGFLLLINLSGIFVLRRDIRFELPKE
ncbi:MAG: alanine/glycine:cation symporter family protein [Parachlamydiales bacterium]